MRGPHSIMVILGIETSCDETSIALLKAEKTKTSFVNEPIASTVASQIKVHAPYGGVVPMLASREHVKNLEIVFQKTILEAFGSLKNLESNIDLIAVTQGPGLIPALLVGVNFAKTLAWAWKKPIIGVNHLEGHLLSFLLEQETKNVFPAICLLVSGGHTQLVYIEKIGDYQVIGETRDDAAGECFDKGARILGLGYPGGPAIATEAEKYKIQNTRYRIQKLPRPMIDSGDHDFSFSGLKTALLYLWQKLSLKERKQLLPTLAYELQESITDVLVEKTLSAGKHYKVKSIILGGGVTANLRLREKFNQELSKQNKPFNFCLPLLKYTTDNAMMIASAGFFNYLSRSKKASSLRWNKIKAEANLRL